MKKFIITGIILSGLLFAIVCSAAQQAGEYQIKAGFLYKFLFFAEWPESAFVDDKTPFTIGILGSDPFDDIFKNVEGQPVNNRKLVIKRIRKVSNGESLKKFHILFISPSLEDKMGDVLESLKNHPVLTVSEVKGFIHSGGIINFVKKKSRVGFEINRTAARRAGIKLRSRLLRVANRVIED